MKYNFENIIKEKANSFEFDYDSKEWSKLSKKLKKPNFLTPKNISFISLAVILISSLVFVVLKNTNKEANSEINKKEIIISNKENVIESTDIKCIESVIKDDFKSELTQTNLEKDKISDNSSVSIDDKSSKQVFSNIDTKQKSDEVNEKINITKNSEKTTTNTRDIDFSINQTFNEGCAPLNISFNANNQAENANYIWDFGDGTLASGFETTHIYKNNGAYKVTLHVEYNNNTQTYSSNVNVKETPVSEFSWTSKDNIFTFTSTTDASSYEWKINNETVSNSSSFDKEFMKSDIYKLQLTTTNLFGCSNTIEKPVKVELEYFIIPNSFTPNGDGVNDNFGPIGEELYNVKYTFMIFDKQGALLFETEDPNKKWDGINYKTNKPATTTTDIFIWKVIIKDSYDKEQIKTGHVTIFVN